MTVTVAETTIEDDGPDGKVFMYTLKNSNNMTVKVMTYGATIVSIEVPDKNGVVKDVVLGFDTSRNMSGFRDSKVNPYFGATVGRVANRITNAQYVEPSEGNRVYELTPNIDPHHLHGGAKGFTFVNWKLHRQSSDAVVFSHRSEDGDEGYPGTVVATVQYKLGEENILYVHMEARTDKHTIINMTNHAYFNLAGHNAGSAKLYEHYVSIDADSYISVDGNLLPNKVESVANTPFDLRQSVKIADLLPKQNGFDHNFCITNTNNKPKEIAMVYHPESGRAMSVFSDQVGVQFYTANSMPDMTQQKKYPTKDGCVYEKKHAAFCLESQKWPDAPNQTYYNKINVSPDQLYKNNIVYAFGCVDITKDPSKVSHAITNYEMGADLAASTDGRQRHFESAASLDFGSRQLDDSVHSTISSLNNSTGNPRSSNTALDPPISSRSSKVTHPLQISGSSLCSKMLSSCNSPHNASKSDSDCPSHSPKSGNLLLETSALLSDACPSPRSSPFLPSNRPSAFHDYGTADNFPNSNLDPQSFWGNLIEWLRQLNCSLREAFRRLRSLLSTYWTIINLLLYNEPHMQAECPTNVDAVESSHPTEQQNDIALVTRLMCIWEWYRQLSSNEELEVKELPSIEPNEDDTLADLSNVLISSSDGQIEGLQSEESRTSSEEPHRIIETQVQIHSSPQEAEDVPQQLPTYKTIISPRTASDINEIVVIESDIEIISESGVAVIRPNLRIYKPKMPLVRLDSISERDDDNSIVTDGADVLTPVHDTSTISHSTECLESIFLIDSGDRTDAMDTGEDISELDSLEIDGCSAELPSDGTTRQSHASIEHSNTMSNTEDFTSHIGLASDESSIAKLEIEVDTCASTVADSLNRQNVITDTQPSGEIQEHIEDVTPQEAVAKSMGAIPKLPKK